MLRINEINFNGNNTEVKGHKQLPNGKVIKVAYKIDSFDNELDAMVNSFIVIVNKTCEFIDDETPLLTLKKISIKHLGEMKKIKVFAERSLQNSETKLKIELPEKFIGNDKAKLNFAHADAADIIDSILKEASKWMAKTTAQLRLFEDDEPVSNLKVVNK